MEITRERCGCTHSAWGTDCLVISTLWVSLSLPEHHSMLLFSPTHISPSLLSTQRRKKGMKVRITAWSAVATWRWDLPEDDVCGICQNHFDGTCPTCRYPGDECSLCESTYDDAPDPPFLKMLAHWGFHSSVWEMRPQLPHGLLPPQPGRKWNTIQLTQA